jgi:DNA-binding response OmpR family regulator
MTHPARKRILCIDGNDDNRFLIAFLLSELGYDCASAPTCTEGLALAMGEPFDLYILDSWYKDGSGVDLTREIRAVDATTPILFFSAWTPNAARVEALSAGADAYLLKPFIEELTGEVTRRLVGIDACPTRRGWSRIGLEPCLSACKPGK